MKVMLIEVVTHSSQSLSVMTVDFRSLVCPRCAGVDLWKS